MVRARQLLPCPEVCPSAVYTLMVECWHEQAVRRPSFPEIGHRLKIWYQAQKRSMCRVFCVLPRNMYIISYFFFFYR